MKSSIKIKGKLRSYIYMPMMLTILLVLFNVTLYIKDLSVGVMFSAFIIFYVVVLLFIYRKYRPKLAQEMVNFATQYGTVQKKLLSEFEIPYVLLDYNAKIMWCNEQFMKVTGIDNDYHKSISAIMPSLTKEIIQKTTPVDSMNMTLDERNYRVSMRRLYFEELTEGSGILDGSESTEYLTAVYLFDETEINHYIKENREQKLVAGLVYIDNYDEALDSIEDVKRSLLVALIDRKVNKYFSEIDALVRKIEKDKYFVVFRYKYLEQLKADKFSLIEDVK
ncbi:MAG: DHH family phosphoesterase, partial [Lachnospiraceae bacterium]|nr:DHH family phosphoesterase [Lachnospiraceae bacterium]